MAKRGKRKTKKRVTRSKLVCPKRHRGKRVIAKKGGCFIETRVKKVSREALKKRAEALKKRAKAKSKKTRAVKARKGCVGAKYKTLRNSGYKALTAHKMAKEQCG